MRGGSLGGHHRREVGGYGMKKPRRKLTAAEKSAKKKWREEHEMIVVHGKQTWIRCPSTIEGVPVSEFIRNNADPVWLHQNGMWEELDQLYAGGLW